MVAKTDYERLVLFVRTASLDVLVQCLMSSSLLKKQVRCSHCTLQMQLGTNADKGDGFRWICMNKHCSHYKTTIGLRVGSFFAGFKASLSDLCTVIFCWLLEKPAKDIIADFGISKNLATKVTQKLRGVISIGFKSFFVN